MHYALMCIMHNEMNCQGGVGRRGGMPIMNAAKTSVNLDKGSGQGGVAEDMSKPPRKKLDKERVELVFSLFCLSSSCIWLGLFSPSFSRVNFMACSLFLFFLKVIDCLFGIHGGGLLARLVHILFLPLLCSFSWLDH